MTPISLPRFSNGKTWATSGMPPSASVRSAHASITVRTREGSRSANVASWSLVKHTTSHRPRAGAWAHTPSWPSLVSATRVL